MPSYESSRSPVSQHGLALAAVIGLHVLVLYGLASGLARKVVQVIVPPIEVEITEQIDEPEPPPPPPPPQFERPQVVVPPPEVSIQIPVETPTAITNVTTKPVATAPVQTPPGPPSPPVARTAAQFDARRSPSTEEYYPPASARLGEEGGTVVDLCISPVGRVSGRPKVAKTSGSRRLDDAAVAYTSRTRWIPATEDGKPVEQCTSLMVRFELKR